MSDYSLPKQKNYKLIVGWQKDAKQHVPRHPPRIPPAMPESPTYHHGPPTDDVNHAITNAIHCFFWAKQH